MYWQCTAQDDELDQPLRTIVTIVRKIADWTSGDEEKPGQKEAPSEEDRKKAREHLQKYNPMIPGKVVYTFRSGFLPIARSGSDMSET